MKKYNVNKKKTKDLINKNLTIKTLQMGNKTIRFVVHNDIVKQYEIGIFLNKFFTKKLFIAYMCIGLSLWSTYYSFRLYQFNYFMGITIDKCPMPPINLPPVTKYDYNLIIYKTPIEIFIHCGKKMYALLTFDPEHYETLFRSLKGQKVRTTNKLSVYMYMYPETVQAKHNWSSFFGQLSLFSGVAVLVSIMVAFN